MFNSRILGGGTYRTKIHNIVTINEISTLTSMDEVYLGTPLHYKESAKNIHELPKLWAGGGCNTLFPRLSDDRGTRQLNRSQLTLHVNITGI